MDIQRENHGIPSEGAPHRLPAWSSATEREARITQVLHATEDKGTVQGIGLDGREQERAGLSRFQALTFATWNIRGTSTGNYTIITKEMEGLNIVVLGIAKH